MDATQRRILRSLTKLYDLDEGRRDLSSLLGCAAGMTQNALDLDLAYAAVAANGSSLVAASENGVPGNRIEAWEGPGKAGEVCLATKEVVVWRKGDDAVSPTTRDFLDVVGAESWIGAPIPLPDRPAGILAGLRRRGEEFTTAEREVMEVLAQNVAMAIANHGTFQEVETLAVTDDLTRVYNYRFLKAALFREVERASRYGQVFSILMLDVDRLKEYNEKHGHLEGSELLRRLAAILTASSRAIDLVAKYGGDEFLIILPQTRTDGGRAMAERLCQAVAQTGFAHARPGEITISAGLATFPQHGATMESLLAAADQALFHAKRSGRNRVEEANAPGTPGFLRDAA